MCVCVCVCVCVWVCVRHMTAMLHPGHHVILVHPEGQTAAKGHFTVELLQHYSPQSWVVCPRGT